MSEESDHYEKIKKELLEKHRELSKKDDDPQPEVLGGGYSTERMTKKRDSIETTKETEDNAKEKI